MNQPANVAKVIPKKLEGNKTLKQKSKQHCSNSKVHHCTDHSPRQTTLTNVSASGIMALLFTHQTGYHVDQMVDGQDQMLEGEPLSLSYDNV